MTEIVRASLGLPTLRAGPQFQNSKPAYDLEERTFQFAKAVRLFVKTLPKTIANIEDGKQLIKASGSVGVNYPPC